ncbi:MAG: sugar phosphate isomerase/epimerase family protein, partial [Halanaerobiales bacterium]
DLDDEEVKRVKKILDRENMRISALGSPIGKIKITADFAPHLEIFKRLITIAHELETNKMRIFSFFLPEEDDPLKWREMVMERMKEMAEIAEKENMVLLCENERDIYGDTPQRCLDLIKTAASPALKLTFDPANFLRKGLTDIVGALDIVGEHVEYIHVKDRKQEDMKTVPAGKGSAQIKEILIELRNNDFDGFLSLEPHLSSGGRFGGFTGKNKFKKAAAALRNLLEELGIEYN